ncbi:phage portal protein family protein [Gynuella sp.]|uniref:phage portal protein family protein n=1 Tax=Gynuella sp. TaxID=2969146 RepID=UPI003D116524
MKNGIWVSPTEFIRFSEPSKRLSSHIVTRDRSPDFSNLGSYLPNPDPILKAKGKDVSIYRNIRSNAAVGGAIRRRKSAVTSLEWGFKERVTSARVEKNIKAILDDLDMAQLFKDILEAKLYGYQPIETLWKDMPRWTVPNEMIAKPPEWFVFSTENELRFRSRQAPIEGESLPERKFLLPRNEATYQNPWGFPEMSMVFWADTFMRGGLRFWVQFAEKYGIPWLIGKVPRNTSKSDQDALADDLEAMIQDAVAVVPDDSSVEIKEAGAKAGAAEAFEKLLMYCRSEINIALLGQNQTTEASATNASAKSGLEVTDDLRDDDASLCESTVNTLIKWIMFANSISGPAPKFEMWEQETVDDTQAKRDKTLTESGVKFKKAYWMRTYDLNEDDLEDDASPDTEQQTAADTAANFAEGDDDIGAIAKRQQDLADQLGLEASAPLQQWINTIQEQVNTAETLDDLHAWLLNNGYGELIGSDMREVLATAFGVSQAQGILDVATEAGQPVAHSFAEPGSFTEQLAALQLRMGNLVPTQRWTDLMGNAHDRAFVVAGAMKADLLQELATAVTKVIQNGGTIESFRKNFDEIVARTGWQYNGERNWRTRVIYSTNMSSTYAAGRYAQLTDPDLQKVAPYWMYRHGGSVEPRPEHLKWDKLTLPADHPWWHTHYTPNGWGCTCYVIAVSEATARRKGGRFEEPQEDQPGDVDAGWKHAPGADIAAELRNIVQTKSVQLDKILADAFIQAMSRFVGD